MAKKTPTKKMHLLATLMLLIVLAAAAYLLVEPPQTPVETSVEGNTPPQTPIKISAELYVMSKCGFSQAAEIETKKWADAVGDYVDVKVYFVGQDGDNLSSMHGQSEVDGDLAEICAMKYAPEKFLDFSVCMGNRMNDIPGNWVSCAQEKGVNADVIRTCMESGEGVQMLRESFRHSADRGVYGTPTMYLDNLPYTDGINRRNLMRHICGLLSYAPPNCSGVKPDASVEAVILTDTGCGDCDKAVSSAKINIGRIIPNVVFRELNASSEEGSRLYNDTGLKILPAILLNESVTSCDNYPQLKSYLTKKGAYYNLNIGIKSPQ